MLDAIETHLFVSDPETFQTDNQTARVSYDSTLAMTSGHFRIAGEIMATSIVQGGPAQIFWLSACISIFHQGSKLWLMKARLKINQLGNL